MSDPNPATTDTLDAAAAKWLACRDRGLTAAEQDDYLQWLRLDPRHGRAVARLERAWGALDALAEWQPEHSAQPNPDLLALPRRRAWWAIPVAGLLAAALAWGLFLHQSPPGESADMPTAGSRDSSAYERRILADGSVVELNRGATVAVNYSEAERQVELLQGEAYFTVAKNEAQPFVVQAGRVRIRALGTVFNVRLDPENGVEVLVTEGRVRVDPLEMAPSVPAAERPLLEAGQRAIITLQDAVMQSVVATVDAGEIAAVLAWQPRWLDFVDAPLVQVLAEFNRQGDGPSLVLGDASLVGLRVGGSFRADNAEAFVRLLEAGFGVRAERTASRIILRKAR